MNEKYAFLILGLCIGIIVTTWSLKLYPAMQNLYFRFKDLKRKNNYRTYEEIEEEN